MKISAKEILTLSAILADKITCDLDDKELAAVKLFFSQLNNDICTIYAAKVLSLGKK